MLDFIQTMIKIFGDFVKMFLAAPFYGTVSYGYLLLAIYIVAIILIFLIGRQR